MKSKFLVSVVVGFILLISSIGRGGVNVWTPFGPEGVEISAMAADPLTPGTVYVGCRNGDGVYKSTDGGLNWGPPMSNGLPFVRVLAIAVSPWTPGEVYVATNELEVYVTADGGMSWSPASSDVAPYDSTDAALVFAEDPTPRLYWAWSGSDESGRTGGVFVRENGVSFWTPIDADLNGQPVYSFAYAPEHLSYPATLYVGLRNGGVFRSEDSGVSWNWVNPDLNQAYATVAVDPSNPSTVYANARNQYVYRSDDRGDTWAEVSDVPRWMFDLWVHPTDHTVFGIGRNGYGTTPTWRNNLFRSDDGGVSWENLTPGMYGARDLAFSFEAGTELYAAIENGMWAYVSGGTGMEWQPRMQELRSFNMVSFAFAPSNPSFLYAASNYTGIYRSSDGGSTFEPIVDGLANRVGSTALAVDPLNHERVYAGGQTADSFNGIDHVFLISSDAGTTWQSLPAQDPPISWWGFTNYIGVDPANPSRIFASTGYFPAGAVRSLDGGDSFQEMTSGFESCEWLNKITITPDAVYGACDSEIGGPVLFKSTDDGLTWHACSAGLEGERGAEILAIDPFDSDIALVGTWERIFRTDEGGLDGCSWEPVEAGLPVGYVWALTYDPNMPGTAYAGIERSGVFRTLDGGLTWEPLNNGLDLESSRRVSKLSIDPADQTRLVAGTGHGLYELKIEALDGDADGVLGSVEDANPNGPDGNGDGINDSEQSNVTSLPTVDDGPYVTIESPEGTAISGVKATSPDDIPVPPPGEAAFPLGMLEFAVSGFAEGAEIDVVVYLPPGVMANSFWKFNSTFDNFAPHWYEFTDDGQTGAELRSDRIVLHFVDGQRGDDDLLVNAVIVEPGAPALVGTELAVDVMPGSKTNPVNLKSHGKTPVAVLTTADLNAADVDPTSVIFAGASPLIWAWEDVDRDGLVDLILNFETQQLDLTSSSTHVTLIAKTLSGAPVWGADVIQILH